MNQKRAHYTQIKKAPFAKPVRPLKDGPQITEGFLFGPQFCPEYDKCGYLHDFEVRYSITPWLLGEWNDSTFSGVRKKVAGLSEGLIGRKYLRKTDRRSETGVFGLAKVH